MYCVIHLSANMPETKDNDFTWKDFQTKNNSELADIYGNFINRVLVLTNKNYNGIVPEASEYTKGDLLILEEMTKFPDKIADSLDKFRFREAQSEMMNLARLGNKYLADQEPWKLIKTDEKRVRTIMNIAVQISANLAIVCEPFLPFTSAKLFKMLNLSPLKWSHAKNSNNISAGHKINENPEILFTKIEDEQVIAQVNKLEESKKLNAAKLSNISSSLARNYLRRF
jgi:methionyl-tRNA synthetase